MKIIIVGDDCLVGAETILMEVNKDILGDVND